MLRKRLLLPILLVALGGGACSLFQVPPPQPNYPVLQSWEGQRIILCCEREEGEVDCAGENWVQSLRRHCDGGAKAVKGEKNREKAGTQYTEKYKEIGESDEYTRIRVHDRFRYSECVTYECSGAVHP